MRIWAANKLLLTARARSYSLLESFVANRAGMMLRSVMQERPWRLLVARAQTLHPRSCVESCSAGMELRRIVLQRPWVPTTKTPHKNLREKRQRLGPMAILEAPDIAIGRNLWRERPSCVAIEPISWRFSRQTCSGGCVSCAGMALGRRERAPFSPAASAATGTSSACQERIRCFKSIQRALQWRWEHVGLVGCVGRGGYELGTS